jgi:hypothetical protein
VNQGGLLIAGPNFFKITVTKQGESKMTFTVYLAIQASW